MSVTWIAFEIVALTCLATAVLIGWKAYRAPLSEDWPLDWGFPLARALCFGCVLFSIGALMA